MPARQLPRYTPTTDPRNYAKVSRHQVAIIETECRGVFEISCRCGEQTWTPWGLEHAKEIARLHYWVTGTQVPANAW